MSDSNKENSNKVQVSKLNNQQQIRRKKKIFEIDDNILHLN